MRRAAKIDANQREIVKQLRALNVSVAVSHDDILVGYKGRTYWFEVKDPGKLLCKDGVTFRKGAITPGQADIARTWRGHYCVVWELDMILYNIGFNGGDSYGIRESAQTEKEAL